eukprot:scaffold134847_cov23-Tisochrysis_lutea.AAC.1
MNWLVFIGASLQPLGLLAAGGSDLGPDTPNTGSIVRHKIIAHKTPRATGDTYVELTSAPLGPLGTKGSEPLELVIAQMATALIKYRMGQHQVGYALFQHTIT